MLFGQIAAGARPRRIMARIMVRIMALSLAVIAALWTAPSRAELFELEQPKAPAYAAKPSFEATDDGAIRFQIQLSEPLAHQVFTLAQPDRLVIDLPEITWRIAPGEQSAGAELGVPDMRYGLFRDGRSRMVLDLSGAPELLRQDIVESASGARLAIEFRLPASVAGDAAEAVARPAMLEIRTRSLPSSEELTERLAAISSIAPAKAPRPRRRPRAITIALDPGHGGHDPGASYGGLREKDLMLSLAKRLRERLNRPGVFEVFLTRETDEYVPLDQRVARARAAGAVLFLSMHADALPNHTEVSGASVYTLSERASDRLSARLARRENAVDAIAGVEMSGHSDDVRQILVDYARRRTMGESTRFADLLLKEFDRRIRVLEGNPTRQAGFRVLKTFDTPAVLIEFGFLTNIRDRRRLSSAEWQNNAVDAVVSAVRGWVESDPSLRNASAKQQ